MKKIISILILTFCQNALLIGQSKVIDSLTSLIDKNEHLTVKNFDANEVYNLVFDGGGFIEVSYDKGSIMKITQEIGVSFGRLRTVIHFENGKPIKIIDSEENFGWREDHTGWNYNELNIIFEAEIYIFSWVNDESKTIKKGNRNLSEGTCSTFEYKHLIELGKELAKKQKN